MSGNVPVSPSTMTDEAGFEYAVYHASEYEALVAERDSLSDQLQASQCAEALLSDEVRGLKEQRDTAREQLLRAPNWMEHTDIGCIESIPGTCTCGLDQFIASLPKELPT
jgi:hypothetical protein